MDTRFNNSPKTIEQRERKLVAIRKYFGFAISQSPHTLYEIAGMPNPETMADMISQTISAQAFELGYSHVTASEDLLYKGIDDVQKILSETLKTRAEAEAAVLARHPKTIHSIAVFALREGKTY